MTQRIEYDSKDWTFFNMTQRIELCLIQRIEPFFFFELRLTEYTFLIYLTEMWLKELNFFDCDSKNWIFNDPKNWTCFSILTQRIEPSL